MLLTQANDVKVYNLSSGKSLPEWISDRKKRLLLKQDHDLRRRIELIQDFDMPTASNCVRVTPDGQYILCTGVYKPRLKCFDVNELSVKFDRCFDSECIKFEMLSEDFSKLVLLQADRYIEFHAQYGRYYRLRMPKFGRDLAYHKPSCDLFLVGDGSDVFRLNLEQGRYLQPYDSGSNEINVCEINKEHQMLTVGTVDGKVVAFDPRAKSKIGVLDVTLAEGIQNGSLPAITALCFRDSLNMAVGTSLGNIFLYDIRSNKPRFSKEHAYNLPISNIIFHKKNNKVITADRKIIKIWDYETQENVTSVEPGMAINDVCLYQDSGLIFLANEASKNSVYYVPSLGQAPRWCSFLDNITEELEESNEIVLYDDYKFVTQQDLENLGLAHLRGTNYLRAYMHGFFIDMRLYHKAKSIVEPFAYLEYRKNRIKQKIEEERKSRIKARKIPKVNRLLAQKLIDEKSRKNKELADAGLQNPLGDDRFAAMFTNKDFEVDMESEEYKLLHPVISKHEKERLAENEPIIDQSNQFQEEIDDNQEDLNLIQKSLKKKKVKKKKVTMHVMSDEEIIKNRKLNDKSIGDMLEEHIESNIIQVSGNALGSRELTFKIKKKEKLKDATMEAHKRERKELRRSTGQLSLAKGKKTGFRKRKI